MPTPLPPAPRAAAVLATAALLTGAVAGCESTGLSPREAHAQTYSNYLGALYEEASWVEPAAAAGAAIRPRPQLRAPLRVGVAQVGEVAPPVAFLARLRKEASLFALVEPVPAAFDGTSAAAYGAAGHVDPADARRRVRAMRQAAADRGADYLLLYGGTMDVGTFDTPAAVADLTIVGAYLMPSRDVKGTATASASLIDVQTGRPVLSASANGERTKWVPTMNQDGARIEVMKELREEVVEKLAEEVVGRVRDRVGQDLGATPPAAAGAADVPTALPSVTPRPGPVSR